MGKPKRKMLLYKKKKNQSLKGNRFLISITVAGSAGPIRFVVNEKESVAAVIDAALKTYAHEGRLPLLGTDLNNFVLYGHTVGTEALSPWETVGSVGVRNFILCNKPEIKAAIDDEKAAMVSQKGSGSWRAWFQFRKTLNNKIYSL